MLQLNEQKALEIIESLFTDIIKGYETAKRKEKSAIVLSNRISQLKMIVSIIEAPLEVETLCKFLGSNSSISDFLQEPIVQDFLTWLHQAKIMNCSHDKFRNRQYYELSNLIRSFKITVWHNKNQLQHHILDLMGKKQQTISLEKLEMVANLEIVDRLKISALEKAWYLTQHLESSWCDKPYIEVIQDSRSTDIGDVLEVDNKEFWVIKSKGFERIEIEI